MPLRSASGELLTIDVMRFIASCAIVLCHSCEFLVPREMREANHRQTEGLTIFVDVFFVISGFVIAYVYAGRMRSLRDFGTFMQRRIGRLMPLHLATLALMALLYVGLLHFRVPLNTQPSLSPRCLIEGALLVHAWIGCGGQPPNGVSWSISAEMAAYLLFPVLLSTLRAPRLARFALLGGLFGFAIWQQGSLALLTESFSAWRALPAFYLGMVVWAERDAFAVPAWLGLAAVALSLVTMLASYALVPRTVIVGLGYLTAGGALLADTVPVRSAWIKRLAPLGQLTYSVYMLHALVIVLLLNGLADKVLHLGLPGMVVVTLLTWSVIGVASLISLQLFETPMRRRIDAWKLFG
ncbi:MAG: acyltransferase [Novosphingobium sp.]